MSSYFFVLIRIFCNIISHLDKKLSFDRIPMPFLTHTEKHTNSADGRRGGIILTTPLYIQADGTLLVQTDGQEYEDIRRSLLVFAELVGRSNPLHVYRIRSMSLWQAASSGWTARNILDFLRRNCAHPVPFELQQRIVTDMSKWGQLTLHEAARNHIILRGDRKLLEQLAGMEAVADLAVQARVDGLTFPRKERALVKRTLAKLGYPVIDRVGYQEAVALSASIRSAVALRHYQKEASNRFFCADGEQSGVIVLPCGSGKTVVGIEIVCRLGLHALVLTPTQTSAQQWIHEFQDKTNISSDDISLYEFGSPLRPITVTTYQKVAAKTKMGNHKHLDALTRHPWGIVVYDEVHMLPAPLFRLAADLQGTRRLGLTATLIREDGAEVDVFSLIGSKIYEVPWKQLEAEGFLATVRCVEIRVPLSPGDLLLYQSANARERHRIASLNPNKVRVLRQLLKQHQNHSILVLGHYLQQLADIARQLDYPLITGQTPQDIRESTFESFRNKSIRQLILSRVANMAVDLPCASVAVQVSGLYGSRQEEAQRLGRLLRPGGENGAFYSIVSQNTVEERMAQHRQMYLVEQGYAYDIVIAQETTGVDAYLLQHSTAVRMESVCEHETV